MGKRRTLRRGGVDRTLEGIEKLNDEVKTAANDWARRGRKDDSQLKLAIKFLMRALHPENAPITKEREDEAAEYLESIKRTAVGGRRRMRYTKKTKR